MYYLQMTLRSIWQIQKHTLFLRKIYFFCSTPIFKNYCFVCFFLSSLKWRKIHFSVFLRPATPSPGPCHVSPFGKILRFFLLFNLPFKLTVLYSLSAVDFTRKGLISFPLYSYLCPLRPLYHLTHEWFQEAWTVLVSPYLSNFKRLVRWI